MENMKIHIMLMMLGDYGVERHFQQYLSYIMDTVLLEGETSRKTLICPK
jgi:hypothetical protein